MTEKHFLIVHTDANNIRLTAMISTEHQQRLTELITEDCPPIIAEFHVKDLTIMLKTHSGGYIILKQK